jgi:CheY-like chemotaxis protein
LPLQTVLLVEDSKLLRVEREHALKKAGYRVVVAVDGVEALEVARDNRPDLILLDMMLPKLDGPSVLRALKADALTAQIPVVVVTGLSQKNEGRLLQDGAAAFVGKDQLLASGELLLHTIKVVLERCAV